MNTVTQAAIHERNEAAILRVQLEQTAVKLATVQAENRRLRKMTSNGKQGNILSRTAADAKQLCLWRWSGLSIARRQAHSYGMSRRRWAWAVALLERARVIAADAPLLDDAFEIEDLPDAVEAIDRTVKVLGETGIVPLIMRLPKNGKKDRKRSR